MTRIDSQFNYGPSRHQAHNLSGEVRAISFPPVDDLTPKPVAKAIEAYRALATEHRSVTGQLIDLRDAPREGTPKVQADARRVALEDARAQLEPQLDDALDQVVAAISSSTWATDLANAKATARDAVADAVERIEHATSQLSALDRLAGWLAVFPSGKGWPDERLANHPRFGTPHVAGTPVTAIVAPLRALVSNGSDGPSAA